MMSLFSYPAFRNLWIGQAISRLGDALYFLGFPFMVLMVTGDPAMVGYVGAIEALPFLLLGPHAGALSDRMDRRKIMLGSDIASSALLLIFAVIVALSNQPPIWSLYVFGFLISAGRVVFMPAKNAAVPNVVPEREVLRANAFAMGTDQVIWLAMMVASGGVLAGLYKLSPIAFYIGFIAVNGASFMGSAYFLAKLPALVPERTEIHLPFREIVEGFRYVKGQHVIGLTMIAQVGVSLSIAPFFTVYLQTNKVWFGGKPETLAWLEAAFVAGMFAASTVVMRIKVERVGLAWSGGLGVAGLAILMMAFTRDFTAFLVWNAVAGIAIGFVDIPMMSYIQLVVPDSLRGRVMSLRNIIMMGTMPIGMAMGGTALKAFGISAMYAIMGALFAISGSACLFSREFRAARMPASDAEAMSPGVGVLDIPGSPPVELAAPVRSSDELVHP